MMSNIPEVRLGIIAVSRDCFPIDLSIRRREAIVKQCRGDAYCGMLNCSYNLGMRHLKG